MGDRDLVVALEKRGIRVVKVHPMVDPGVTTVELGRADGLGVVVVEDVRQADRIKAPGGSVDYVADDIFARVSRALSL